MAATKAAIEGLELSRTAKPGTARHESEPFLAYFTGSSVAKGSLVWSMRVAYVTIEGDHTAEHIYVDAISGEVIGRDQAIFASFA